MGAITIFVILIHVWKRSLHITSLHMIRRRLPWFIRLQRDAGEIMLDVRWILIIMSLEHFANFAKTNFLIFVIEFPINHSWFYSHYKFFHPQLLSIFNILSGNAAVQISVLVANDTTYIWDHFFEINWRKLSQNILIFCHYNYKCLKGYILWKVDTN